ncbi:MAG: hypothetical protein WBV22_05135 [Anaerolineaceae bacterium]
MQEQLDLFGDIISLFSYVPINGSVRLALRSKVQTGILATFNRPVSSPDSATAASRAVCMIRKDGMPLF